METDRGTILIVDGKLDNLRLLTAILSAGSYKVRKALNGATALHIALTVSPDLILLEINMPEMNGYEVCQALKADERLQEIPVIFTSAINDVIDKVKAFKIGGADYITQPFQGEEIIARIENQLTIQQQRKQLQREIEERQKVEETLRFYLHAVSHDLRNPVLGMSMVLKNLLANQPATSPTAASRREDSEPSKQQAILIPRSILERMKSSCDRQLHLINSLVEIQQFERVGIPLQYQPLSLYSLTEQLAAELEPMFRENQALLNNQISPDLPPVSADSNHLWRVFENIITNALKHNPPGIQVTLRAEIVAGAEDNSIPNHSWIRCTITDSGLGMQSELAGALFERYWRGESGKRTLGLGLGLYLCRQIIKAHGGEIGAITAPNAGTQFWFTLPISELESKTSP